MYIYLVDLSKILLFQTNIYLRQNYHFSGCRKEILNEYKMKMKKKTVEKTLE